MLRTLTSGEYACKPEEEPGSGMNNKSQIPRVKQSGACARTMGCTERAEMVSLPIPCPPTVRLLYSMKAYSVYAHAI